MPYDITFLESNIWQKGTYLQKRNKLMDMENRLVVAKMQGEGWEALEVWGYQLKTIVFGVDKQ